VDRSVAYRMCIWITVNGCFGSTAALFRYSSLTAASGGKRKLKTLKITILKGRRRPGAAVYGNSSILIVALPVGEFVHVSQLLRIDHRSVFHSGAVHHRPEGADQPVFDFCQTRRFRFNQLDIDGLARSGYVKLSDDCAAQKFVCGVWFVQRILIFIVFGQTTHLDQLWRFHLFATFSKSRRLD